MGCYFQIDLPLCQEKLKTSISTNEVCVKEIGHFSPGQLATVGRNVMVWRKMDEVCGCIAERRGMGERKKIRSVCLCG